MDFFAMTWRIHKVYLLKKLPLSQVMIGKFRSTAYPKLTRNAPRVLKLASFSRSKNKWQSNQGFYEYPLQPSK